MRDILKQEAQNGSRGVIVEERLIFKASFWFEKRQAIDKGLKINISFPKLKSTNLLKRRYKHIFWGQTAYQVHLSKRKKK